ncbi:hypothetical protein TI04_12300 [Achromatium sp. WMS2]|nr:hypothetical protein TI04_12300 [Achromatium sp. WMS2]
MKSAKELFSAVGIRGVLIPAGRRSILLPNVAVAEIISFKSQTPPTPKEDAPKWLLGHINWRSVNLPIISWERLVENREPNWQEPRIRIAVLNTINGNRNLTHIGLLSAGITRLIKIRPEILEEDTNFPIKSPLIKAAATIAGTEVWIPDLDQLEKQLLTLPR